MLSASLLSGRLGLGDRLDGGLEAWIKCGLLLCLSASKQLDSSAARDTKGDAASRIPLLDKTS